MTSGDVKRKLRQLKRLEEQIRARTGQRSSPLVWDTFFDLHGGVPEYAKYPLAVLLAMDDETLRWVIAEYWSFVWQSLWPENNGTGTLHFNAEALLRLGLPATADEDAVKTRFRELAKQHHPDTGGDASQFIALMEDYRRLIHK